MRDELARVIEKTFRDWGQGRDTDLAPIIAHNVRAFLASDEAVDRVALAIKNEGRRFMGFDPVASLDDLEDHQKRDELRIARAALTAAVGEGK